MIIDHKQLSLQALEGLIQAFISQEGTDYGEIEVSLLEKTIQVKKQLEQGEALVVYDEKTESVSILSANQVSLLLGKNVG